MRSKISNLAAALALAFVHPAAPAHDLQAGQQLTFVLSDSKPGGEKVAEYYFSKAFPLAQANGMRELTTFKVQKTLYGEGTPQGSGLYLWPSRDAAQRTRLSESYVKELRPLRTQAWNDLKSVAMQIPTAMELNLDRTRVYTAELIWVKDKQAYDMQFRDSQTLRDKAGARTVLNLPASRHENLEEGETVPPDYVVLLEWPSAEATASYFSDPAFAALRGKYKRNVSRVELYQLGFWE